MSSRRPTTTTTTGPDGPQSTSMPAFPPVTATFHDDGTVEVDLLGDPRTFTALDDGPAPRTQALTHLHAVARQLNRPVRVATTHPAGTISELVVIPSGDFYDPVDPQHVNRIADLPGYDNDVDLEESPDVAPAVSHAEPSVQVQVVASGAASPPVAFVDRSAAPDPGDDHGGHVDASTPPSASAPRVSFIRTDDTPAVAELGWRGSLNRLGLHLAPGPTETIVRRDIAAVRQQWDGPRTIAIANGKGSANKTPTTALLAAVLARYGGAGVLAWDNNETRGSLAWRTEQAHHGATVLDLLPAVDHLMSDTAQVAELGAYLHHQPADKYDVLASDQSAAGDHEVTAVDVERIHRLASRYYRLILMDSGNNERANNWRTMMNHAHTLVVPCTNVEDTAEAAARMLEALHARDEHSAHLAGNAIAVVSQRTPGKDPNMGRIVDGLRPLVCDVVTIPYDPAMVTGTIRYDQLRQATQRAWLDAAATVALHDAAM